MPSHYTGGNTDNWRIGQGATMSFPDASGLVLTHHVVGGNWGVYARI